MLMDIKQTTESLKEFAKYVIQQSRSNLTKKKINNTKGLYDSLDYKIKKTNEGIYLDILMDEYGEFVDQGVKGANPNLVKDGEQKAPNSPYKYTNKKPPVNFIRQWAKQRNFRLRDEKGRFKKGNYEAIGYILQKSIFAQGMKPTFFLTKPFEQAFKRLPKEMEKAFAKDFINITIEPLR